MEWDVVLGFVVAATPGFAALVHGVTIFVRLQERVKLLEITMRDITDQLREASKRLDEAVERLRSDQEGRCRLHDSFIRKVERDLGSIESKVDMLQAELKREGS